MSQHVRPACDVLAESRLLSISPPARCCNQPQIALTASDSTATSSGSCKCLWGAQKPDDQSRNQAPHSLCSAALSNVLTNVFFVQIDESICSKCKMYLSKRKNVFVQEVKCICNSFALQHYHSTISTEHISQPASFCVSYFLSPTNLICMVHQGVKR